MNIKKRGRGRPKIENPSSESLKMRLTPDQLTEYQTVADSEQLPLTTWAKQELDRAVRRWRKREHK